MKKRGFPTGNIYHPEYKYGYMDGYAEGYLDGLRDAIDLYQETIKGGQR